MSATIGNGHEGSSFHLSVETYCKSNLPKQEIHLVILGEGEEKARLQKQIEQSQLSGFIHLLGFTQNTTIYIKNAEFLVLTSQYEGFPMVILEALHLGTPVISFDCETGPSEMILHENNGLLIENQNFEELQSAMNTMVENNLIYQTCRENTKNSIAQFSAANIQKKWLELLNRKTN